MTEKFVHSLARLLSDNNSEDKSNDLAEKLVRKIDTDPNKRGDFALPSLDNGKVWKFGVNDKVFENVDEANRQLVWPIQSAVTKARWDKLEFGAICLIWWRPMDFKDKLFIAKKPQIKHQIGISSWSARQVKEKVPYFLLLSNHLPSKVPIFLILKKKAFIMHLRTNVTEFCGKL